MPIYLRCKSPVNEELKYKLWCSSTLKIIDKVIEPWNVCYIGRWNIFVWQTRLINTMIIWSGKKDIIQYVLEVCVLWNQLSKHDVRPSRSHQDLMQNKWGLKCRSLQLILIYHGIFSIWNQHYTYYKNPLTSSWIMKYRLRHPTLSWFQEQTPKALQLRTW